jgi:hypothetical protein
MGVCKLCIVSGFHGAWNRRVGVKHPALWTFIRHLKDSQTLTELAIDSVNNGERGPKQKKKWRILNKRFKKIKQRYTNGAITLDRYWRSVSHLMHQKF